MRRSYPPYVNFANERRARYVAAVASNSRMFAIVRAWQDDMKARQITRQDVPDLLMLPVQRIGSIDLLLARLYEGELPFPHSANNSTSLTRFHLLTWTSHILDLHLASKGPRRSANRTSLNASGFNTSFISNQISTDSSTLPEGLNYYIKCSIKSRPVLLFTYCTSDDEVIFILYKNSDTNHTTFCTHHLYTYKRFVWSLLNYFINVYSMRIHQDAVYSMRIPLDDDVVSKLIILKHKHLNSIKSRWSHDSIRCDIPRM